MAWLAAGAGASFLACFLLAASCAAEDFAVAVFPLASAIFAGLAVGFCVVKGSRLRMFLGALASIAVAIVSGGLTLYLSAMVWIERCFTLS